jgi:carboxymethylenebutenolidase
VFTLGFCVGGSLSWGQSALDERLAGVIGLYGRPSDIQPLVPRMRVPLLALTAGADFMTSAEDNRAFDAELTKAGLEHEFALYEGAPHGFFDSGAPGQEAACADAWQRILAFINQHGGERKADAT